MFKTISILTLGIVLAIASQTWAAQILSFEPDPISNNAIGFAWTGNNLITGAGMTSNGDGNNQAPGGDGNFATPGIRTSTPFIINGVSSSHVNTFSTTFFDTALSVTGLAAAGTAFNFNGLLIQNLTAGTFQFMSSNDTVGGPQLLLAGSIGGATLSGINGSNTGSVISATVTYTAGLIFNAMVANGFLTSGNSSWSLIDITPPLAIDSGTGRMRAFQSDSSGLFDADRAPNVIPAPAALPAGLALLTGFGLMRRKMRRD